MVNSTMSKKRNLARIGATLASAAVLGSVGLATPAAASTSGNWEEVSTTTSCMGGSWTGWQAECQEETTYRNTYEYCDSPDLLGALSSWGGMADWYTACHKTVVR